MTDEATAVFYSSHLFTNNEASVALEVVTPSQLSFHVMPSKSDVRPTVNGISPADPTVCVQSICLLVRQNISALTCEETCTLLGSPFVCSTYTSCALFLQSQCMCTRVKMTKYKSITASRLQDDLHESSTSDTELDEVSIHRDL